MNTQNDSKALGMTETAFASASQMLKAISAMKELRLHIEQGYSLSKWNNRELHAQCQNRVQAALLTLDERISLLRDQCYYTILDSVPESPEAIVMWGFRIKELALAEARDAEKAP